MEKFFKLSQKNTTVKTEIIAGITTFLAMVYILGVNSGILSANNSGLSLSGVFFATAMASGIACILMGLIANLPVALAPGMGVNAFFAYTVVLDGGYSGSEALAIVFLSGIIFLLISVSGIRSRIIKSIPTTLKHAIGGAIGFFISFLGLKNAGIIVGNPNTFVGLGPLRNPTVALAIFGLVVTLILMAKKFKSAVFIGMVITAVFGLILGMFSVSGMPQAPTKLIDLQFDTSTVGAMFDGLKTVLTKPRFFTYLFTFLFIDFFDTTGTLIAVCGSITKHDKSDEVEGMDKALIADSVGTMIGAVLGTSTVTSFVESTSGVAAGGRSGLTATTTGVLFLLATVLSPLVSLVGAIPVGENFFVSPIVAPALIVVGILMAGQLKYIDFENFEEAAPAFITIIAMMLTFSIGEGIAAGFITYGIVKAVNKKWEDLSIITIILILIFVFHFFQAGA